MTDHVKIDDLHARCYVVSRDQRHRLLPLLMMLKRNMDVCISTFERPYGPSSQVDIQLIARVDTRPRTTSSFGFVYVPVFYSQNCPFVIVVICLFECL